MNASMRPVLTGLALALVVVTAGGCSNQTVKKVKALADRACACKDAACADKVDADYQELAKHPARGSKDDRDQIQKDFTRMRGCLARARAASPGKAGSAPSGSGSEAHGVTRHDGVSDSGGDRSGRGSGSGSGSGSGQ